jgi:hypothetical protein
MRHSIHCLAAAVAIYTTLGANSRNSPFDAHHCWRRLTNSDPL